LNIDDFVRLAKTRRSVRNFQTTPVDNGCIEKVLEAARWAQSGANAQPWEFIVVKNRETIDRIAELYTEGQKRCWDIEKTRIMEARHPVYREEPTLKQPGFQDAPVLIVVCGDPRTIQATVLITHFLPNEGGPGAHFYKNMANTTQIMTLAVASCGLGAQWISVNSTIEGRLKSLLDVPEEIAIHTIVAIGYPAHEPAPGYRRNLNEIVHFEKYDREKSRNGDDIYQFLLALRRKTGSSYHQPGDSSQSIT
jgi:nitroreductase